MHLAYTPNLLTHVLSSAQILLETCSDMAVVVSREEQSVGALQVVCGLISIACNDHQLCVLPAVQQRL